MLGLHTQLACIYEATACKPGNVHRWRDLPHFGYVDLLQSAAAIAPVFESATGRSVGEVVLDAIQATRRVVAKNTNLGVVLLFAPLAVSDDIIATLNATTVADAVNVYRAIRLAVPGGLGSATEQDVANEPTVTLMDAMRLAADRDAIAAEYVSGFARIFGDVQRFATAAPLESTIVQLHRDLLARRPDTQIARKCGREVAIELMNLAQAGGELDAWFAVDPIGRNPGATADIVAACLFAALRRGIIPVPLDRPWIVP